MKRTRIPINLVALAAAAGAIMMAMTDAGSAQTTIRVGGATEPIIIAQGKGWFKEAGLNVEVTDVKNFMQYPSMLAAKSIDILDGYIPANLWNMIHAGADFRIISGSALAVAAHDGKPARNIRGYVVRKDLYDSKAITKIGDFAGKRLADFAPVPPKGQISPFPIGHKVFGDVFTKVDWVRMSESDILTALASKTIDGARMRSRWVKLAVEKGLAVELVRETDYVSRIQVRALVGRDEFLKQNKEAVVKFLKVYLRALAYAAEVQNGKHKDEYLSAVKSHSDLPGEIALDLIQEVEFTSEIATADLQATQEHFVMVGAQKAVIPLSKAIDLSYLNAAKK
ncbi:MAG: ABC transporter substrate-binding protein [Nitrospira sp.]|nr:ABC transporter substrate-binding protein [Nitrospira sp.]MBX3513151.1 ABC transporter substrate-binding protein [Xanthobacteraceae bacterium]MBX3521183.1 ABC transporter substrate-binding protein [Xanthobacteraceae bacterium]MCW5675396.1 ABC transporter substrate-binding protein [Xanthobacteraceae bacterium]